MLRFINRFMGSNELTAWLGAQNEAEEGDFDELIAFVKVFIDANLNFLKSLFS